MRKRLNYANVAATLALVLAMTGTAVAAKHYLISSTKQISPKVLAKLRGKPGPAGTAGAQGKEGPQGKEGAAGKTGERGPSAAFAAETASAGFPGSTGAADSITELTLAPGKYVLLATVTPHNESAAATEAECVLREQPVGGGPVILSDEATTTLEAKAKAGARRSLALSAATALEVSTHVALTCKTPSTEGAYQAAHLTATQVASIG